MCQPGRFDLISYPLHLWSPLVQQWPSRGRQGGCLRLHPEPLLATVKRGILGDGISVRLITVSKSGAASELSPNLSDVGFILFYF